MFNSYSDSTIALNPGLCTGCSMCVTVCPHGVFSLHDGKASLEHGEACMECGACGLNCPEGAIEVDSGVGCAAAMMWSALKGKKEVSCDCRGCC